MSTGRLVHLILVIAFWAVVVVVYVTWRVNQRRDALKEAAVRQATVERLLRPDWEFYERHLGRPAPTALRNLFADRNLIAACGLKFEKGNGLSTFNPLARDCLLDPATTGVGHDMVPLAFSECGDAIYLRPGATELDTVYIADHDDPGKVRKFADSVGLMVQKLRGANPVI